MDAGEDVFLRLGIDGRTLFHDAAERRLDVPAGAAEAIIQVHVPEGGIEVVLKQPMHHTTADPAGIARDGMAWWQNTLTRRARCWMVEAGSLHRIPSAMRLRTDRLRFPPFHGFVQLARDTR
jgi:hypothetical protein